MGGDSLLFPASSDLSDKVKNRSNSIVSPLSLSSMTPSMTTKVQVVEETSILSVIKNVILNAKRDGCWRIGKGGINHPPSDKSAAAALDNLPVSSVLNCGIDLWRNLEIDDDELLEIAIRDVAYQIQLHEDGGHNEDGNDEDGNDEELKINTHASNIDANPTDETKEDYTAPTTRLSAVGLDDESWQTSKSTSFPDDLSGEVSPTQQHQQHSPQRHRFNPRIDPTVLFLEIKKLTFNLENFLFRIEKHESKKTIFDPAFEGTGSILVKNVLIKLRVECVKGYIPKPPGRNDIPVPVLQLSELDVSLEQVKLAVQDTGADWVLNKIVDGFGDKFAEIISVNLCDQVRKQMEEALLNINGYFEENPEVLLGVLDISLDDLDELTVFV